MDPPHEKHTKHQQDLVGTSKRGRFDKSKAPVSHGPPPPCHHPSHSSDEYDLDWEMLERHSPIERSSHMALRYSKKMKQCTINGNHQDPVYDCSKQSSSYFSSMSRRSAF
jgi:hypothetical protein